MAEEEKGAALSEKERTEMLRLRIVKRVYNLSIISRFSYVRSYTVKQRVAEEKENPLVKKIRATVFKLMGRKEER